jgi:hypothetical protein
MPHDTPEDHLAESQSEGTTLYIDPTYFGVTIFQPPKYVGSWRIGGSMQVQISKQPTEAHIKAHSELLGWEWIQYDSN